MIREAIADKDSLLGVNLSEHKEENKSIGEREDNVLNGMAVVPMTQFVSHDGHNFIIGALVHQSIKENNSFV